MSDKKNKKTTVKKYIYKAADMVGHGIRKALPYIGTAAAAAVVAIFTGKNNDSNHNA